MSDQAANRIQGVSGKRPHGVIYHASVGVFSAPPAVVPTCGTMMIRPRVVTCSSAWVVGTILVFTSQVLHVFSFLDFFFPEIRDSPIHALGQAVLVGTRHLPTVATRFPFFPPPGTIIGWRRGARGRMASQDHQPGFVHHLYLYYFGKPVACVSKMCSRSGDMTTGAAAAASSGLVDETI